MSMQSEVNPREMIGGNSPDYAREISEQLERDYAGTKQTVAALLDEARALPKEIDSDSTMGVIARVIKRIRDLNGQVEAYRVKEKEPHLRRGDAVQQFFVGLNAKLLAAKKTDAKGAGDILQDRINRYMDEKEAKERAARQEQERIARDAAAKAEAARQEAERIAREAEAKAARARNEESIAANKKIADEARRKAEAAVIAAASAKSDLSDATEQANAKPADLTRTRLDDGVMVTMKQEWHVEITDSEKLDAKVLWAFVKDDAKLAALKAWGKITQHKKPMEGASITQRNTAPVR